MAAETRVPEVELWLGRIAKYDKAFKPWESRVEKILKRYTDQQTGTKTHSRFNILWSNVQTLIPATFSRIPQPDVSRRFKDNDPVGRVSGLILERGLDYDVQHYPDYRVTLKAVVQDRFLGGRGCAWVRYEPHFRAMQLQTPPEGLGVTEDVDDVSAQEEELDYECAPVDYVHWRDFGHTVARSWEEVPAVWRRVFMTREALIERFGEEGEKVPLDAKPEDAARKEAGEDQDSQALVYEIWDKSKKEALWISKSLGTILDRRPDPLELDEFFPCPKPLYATLINESLVPTPDYTLYQDLAADLDILVDRIDGLVKALQVKGVYDGSQDSAIARLFTEGENGTLLPVKNWAAFAEKNGLKGCIDVYDLTPIAAALKVAFESFNQLIELIYQLTGLSDIVRGQTDPNETLGAQKLKGQYVSLRLKNMQEDVARFATDLLRLKSQVMCGQFEPKTVAQMASVEQLNPADQQYVPQAMQVLFGERLQDPNSKTPNPLRAFRIEIATDTLVQLDEQAEKEGAVELLTAIGSFLKNAGEVAQTVPQLAPMLMEMLKFAVSKFKAGKTVEGAINQAIDKLNQAQAQPPKPDPKAEVAKIKAQADIHQANVESQITPIRAQAEMAKAQSSIQAAQVGAQTAQIKAQSAQQTAQLKLMQPPPRPGGGGFGA